MGGVGGLSPPQSPALAGGLVPIACVARFALQLSEVTRILTTKAHGLLCATRFNSAELRASLTTKSEWDESL